MKEFLDKNTWFIEEMCLLRTEHQMLLNKCCDLESRNKLLTERNIKLIKKLESELSEQKYLNLLEELTNETSFKI